MDIRNFFGGGGSSKPSSTKKSTNSNNNNDKKSNSSDNKKIIKTMEQIANDQSDSDTDMDDDKSNGNIGSGMKVSGSGGSGKKDATHKSNGAPSSKQVDSDASTTTDDDDVVQIKKKKKLPQASPIKKRKADSSDDDDSDKSPTSDKKKKAKKVIDSSEEEEEEEEDDADLDDYLEQMKKRRAEAMGNGGNDDTKGKKKAKPTKAASKKKAPPRKKYVDSSDSDDDEVMKDVESNDDDSDDDFQPTKKQQESDSEEDEEVVEVQPKKKKPKASPKTSPKRKPTAPNKKKTSPKKESEQPNGPPKYHPPSSKLSSHIPYLETQITKSHETKSDLPKLPNDNPNFSDIEFTPGCLSGLTFVFSGILSTNDVATTATNTAMAINSPTKGEYYINRSLDCSNINCELSRDTATDIIKILGGKVTTSVSGKTDYLVCGNILEDGRQLEEGSKYRKCMELWSGWKDKWRKEYTGEESSSDDDSDSDDEGDKKKKKPAKKKKLTAAQLKAKDPDTLVEVIRGIYEFYGLVTYLSEWKKGTLPEGERMELEARQRAQQAGEKKEAAAPVVGVKKEEVKMEAKAPANPYANKAPPANPYANKAPPANPYAAKSSGGPVNPYAKKAPPANPYANKASSTNPYASKSSTFSSGNPYASKPADAAVKTENGGNINHPGSGKELRENSLWADKYAPSSSMEILGNADSVNKLKKWLREWESKFINPKVKVKGLTGSNGPWKAALLSGPPGIGKTTTATLVARESGRDVLELNASDARSKKALSNALGDVTGSQVLSFDNMGDKKNKKKAPIQKRCIIMDEVDGMGAGDRSGMSELIQMIKKSKVPIICICNDRSSQKMKSLVGYCLDLRYRRPTKKVIARRAMQIGNIEGMKVEENAAEAMAESCGNDIRQVLNSLQMWSCNKNKTSSNGGSSGTNITYRDLKERQSEINKDEVLRVSMFDACKSIVEGARGLSGSDAKAANASFYKRTDAYFVDYMLMGLMVHQNYLKVCGGQYNAVKVKGDDDGEIEALNEMSKATDAMSDFGMAEANLRGGDQNWALLPLCSVLAVKVGHHAGGPTGGMLPGYAEFAGWLGKNSSRNKKIRLLQELRRHMNYKVSADAPELRMNYLPIMRKQFEELLFCKDGAMVTEAIELMDEYGLDRDDVFENFDEFLFNAKDLKVKKFGDLDSKTKSAFTRAYNSMAHSSQALVAEQGAEKTGRKKASGGGDAGMGGAELDVVDDDKVDESDDDDEEDDIEALQKKFLKKGRKSSSGRGKAKANGKKKGGKKKK